jgi:hypothetical protein
VTFEVCVLFDGTNIELTAENTHNVDFTAKVVRIGTRN